MFKPGDKLILSVIDNGHGVIDHFNNIVLEYDDGLVKVDQNGKIFVYNMRSRNFVKAVMQK
jgi:hypothetical protein